MFIVSGKCPVCYATWSDSEYCPKCGGIAEIFFERDIPDKKSLNLDRLQRVVNSTRSRLSEYPNDGIARYLLGMTYVHMGLLSEGAREIKSAADLMPEKIEIRYESAALLAKEGVLYEDALAEVNMVLERRPKFKEALYLCGALLKKVGEQQAAVGAFQKAYQLDNEYAPAQSELKNFVASERQYVVSSAVLNRAQTRKINHQALIALQELTQPRPTPPARMGRTSLQIIEFISPNTARRMRNLYANDADLYEKKLDKRENYRRSLDDDLVTLADLCMVSYEIRQKQQTRVPSGSLSVAGAIPTAERSAILEREIQRYQKEGFRLVSRTETTAQLYRPKEFSCCLAVILVFLIIGIVIYLIYYLTKKDDSLFIEVDETGKIKRTFA